MSPRTLAQRLRGRWRLLTARRAPPPAPLAVTHPVLGALQGTTARLTGRVPFLGSDIALHVHPDGEPVDACLAFAERLAAALARVHATGLGRIADGYLDVYNSDWRIGDATQPDGRTQRFEHPPLTRDDFIARLRLTELAVTGTALSDLTFDCGDLFWGHWFSVGSFHGVDFTEPFVELQG